MSNAVFPSQLIGFTWDSKKKPIFNNITHSPPSGRDVRISLYSQPVYEFTLSNQWLSKTDKDMLIGFFIARRGNFDSFLYTDEDSVIQQQALTRDKGSYQLVKSTDGAIEIINNVVGEPDIYVDDVLQVMDADYYIDDTGLIGFYDFVSGLVTWSGSAYYRSVFLEDSLEYNQFADRLYDCGEIKFKGCLANKL